MFILASKSPRRQQLLRESAIPFVAEPAAEAEKPWDGKASPAEYVQALALAKAREVSARHARATVLGADTIVALGGRLFGKPRDLGQAAAMLAELSGKAHQVFTGVAIVQDGGVRRAWVSCTTVHFKSLTADGIQQYFRLVNPLDKAGGYGIQEHGNLLVESIDGLWSNVVGLPVEEVINELRTES